MRSGTAPRPDFKGVAIVLLVASIVGYVGLRMKFPNGIKEENIKPQPDVCYGLHSGLDSWPEILGIAALITLSAMVLGLIRRRYYTEVGK